jgi:hypothetical protein
MPRRSLKNCSEQQPHRVAEGHGYHRSDRSSRIGSGWIRGIRVVCGSDRIVWQRATDITDPTNHHGSDRRASVASAWSVAATASYGRGPRISRIRQITTDRIGVDSWHPRDPWQQPHRVAEGHGYHGSDKSSRIGSGWIRGIRVVCGSDRIVWQRATDITDPTDHHGSDRGGFVASAWSVAATASYGRGPRISRIRQITTDRIGVHPWHPRDPWHPFDLWLDFKCAAGG